MIYRKTTSSRGTIKSSLAPLPQRVISNVFEFKLFIVDYGPTRLSRDRTVGFPTDGHYSLLLLLLLFSFVRVQYSMSTSLKYPEIINIARIVIQMKIKDIHVHNNSIIVQIKIKNNQQFIISRRAGKEIFFFLFHQLS